MIPVVSTRIKLCLLERVEPCLQRLGSYPMNIIISVINLISYITIYKKHCISLLYNIYYTIFETSHYIRDGVLGVLAQYFNILLSCELTKKNILHLCIIFKESKVVLGGKYIFVLITVTCMAHCFNINFSLTQKITLNNVQNRRVLVL